MPQYGEIEIALRRGDQGIFRIALRYRSPLDDVERGGDEADSITERDLKEIGDLEDEDPAQYGASLFGRLFRSSAVRQAYDNMRTSAQAQGLSLRVRLSLDQDATSLHLVPWERAFTSEADSFSRFILARDYRPVRVRARSAWRALVAIANPTTLAAGVVLPGGRKLPPIDVAAERERAAVSLGWVTPIFLHDTGRVTLPRILEALRREEYELLYLLCHGAIVEGTARIWLDDATGQADVVPASEFARAIADLPRRPTFVVLGSCDSAGPGPEGGIAPLSDAERALASADTHQVLAALGPGVAAAGVPAVLGMQGEVSMATLAKFMPSLFTQLQSDPYVDHAVAVARQSVRSSGRHEPLPRDEWWVPALYMQLKSGAVWYEPGFADAAGITPGNAPPITPGAPALLSRPAFRRWQALGQSLIDGTCTPVLGPGLLERYIGTREEVAAAVAKRRNVPLRYSDLENLPRVAQFLTDQQSHDVGIANLLSQTSLEVARRFPAQVSGESLERLDEMPLSDRVSYYERTLESAWRSTADSTSSEPHALLASLRCATYITSNFDNLLAAALEDVKRTPIVTYQRATEDLRAYRNRMAVAGTPAAQAEVARLENYIPTPDAPLVFHAFGRFAVPSSLVITEDDYFDYLLGLQHRSSTPLPNAIRG